MARKEQAGPHAQDALQAPAYLAPIVGKERLSVRVATCREEIPDKDLPIPKRDGDRPCRMARRVNNSSADAQGLNGTSIVQQQVGIGRYWSNERLQKGERA